MTSYEYEEQAVEVKKMSEPVTASFAKLVKLIESANQQSISCVIHFSDEHLKAGRILIKKGEIIFISYNDFRGTEAISKMKNLSTIRYRIARFLPMPKDRHLPDTKAILNDFSSPDSPASQEATEEKSAPPSGDGLKVTEKQMIHDILSDIVGPMADFLIEDYVACAHNLDEAVDSLSEELSTDDMATFRDELSQRL